MSHESILSGAVYTIDGPVMQTTGSTRLYNYTLYTGAGHTKLTIGDRPAISMWCTLHLSDHMQEDRHLWHNKFGELILGYELSGKICWLHERDDIHTIYHPNYVEYVIRDGDVILTFVVMPDSVNDGYIVRYQADAVSAQEIKLLWKFGAVHTVTGRPGEQVSENVYPVGYVHDIFEVQDENAAHIENGAFSMHSMHFPELHTRGGAEGFTLAIVEADGKKFIAAEKQLILHTGQPQEGYIVIDWIWAKEYELEGMAEKTVAAAETFKTSQAFYDGVCQRLIVETPDARLNSAVNWVNNGIQANWMAPGFSHDPCMYNAYYLIWRGWYGVIQTGVWEEFRSAIELHATVRDTADSYPAYEKDWSYKYFLRGKTPPGRIYASFTPHCTIDPANYGHWDCNQLFIDFIYRYYQWTADVTWIRKLWPVIQETYTWLKEAREVDGGLYVNVLNTWISDSHEYHQGKCTQESAYVYANSLAMAEMAEALGEDGSYYRNEAAKIHRALLDKLWLNHTGHFAEYIDAIDILHPAPELASIYHPIEFGVADAEMTYQMAKYVRDNYDANGKVLRGSNWYPPGRCSNQVLPSETLNTVVALYKLSETEYTYQLFSAFLDSLYHDYPPRPAFMPMTFPADSGEPLFMDDMGLFVRATVEGLFGIEPRVPEQLIIITPNFPTAWPGARIKQRIIEYSYEKNADNICIAVKTTQPLRKQIRLPLAQQHATAVTCNSKAIPFRHEAGIGRCFVVFESTELSQQDSFQISLAPLSYQVNAEGKVLPKENWRIAAQGCKLLRVDDPQAVLEQIELSETNVTTIIRAEAAPGKHVVFAVVQAEDIEITLPVEIEILASEVKRPVAIKSTDKKTAYQPISIDDICNARFEHFPNRIPAETVYSSGLHLRDGHLRHEILGDATGWLDWTYFRDRITDGIFKADNGIPFQVAREDDGALRCIILATEKPAYLFRQDYLNWHNPGYYDYDFPSTTTVTLNNQKATGIRIMLAGAVSHMQSYIDNIRIEVMSSTQVVKTVCLGNPTDFDMLLYHTNANFCQPLSERKYENKYIPGTFNQAHFDIVDIPLDNSEIDGVRISILSLDTAVAIAGLTVESES
jgi:hypothetical protein